MSVEPSPFRVLIVDDNVASGELLAEILSLEGYVVRIAHCGNDALLVAREFVPAIALLDIGLPDVDGFALAKQLKADVRLARTRLIALSGYAHSETGVNSGATAFDRYLVKPVHIEQLLSLLRQLQQPLDPSPPGT